MIENIEELGAKLSPKTLPEMPVLGQGQIEIAKTRVRKHIAAHIPEMSEGRRNHDGVALSVATKQIEGCGRWTERIARIEGQRLCGAGRVSGA